MSGQVVHFELPADDLERAKAFYREAFGWRLEQWGDMPYTMVSTTPTDDNGMPTLPGAINGGMLPRQSPITGPVITISVDSVDAALARVEELGGKTAMAKQPVGDIGFTGYFVDPEGNVMGLWENAR
jgi:uncharacterized protein